MGHGDERNSSPRGTAAPMRVLYDSAADDHLVRKFEELLDDGFVFQAIPHDDTGFAAALVAAEVVVHVLDPIDAGLIDAAPELRLIQKFGAGVDTIDLQAAAARAVTVANMPGANAPAVAEHTVALLVGGLRRLAAADRSTRSGTDWNDQPVASEVGGKTVGLIGFGEIGRRVAVVLEGFGATVLHTSRHSGRPGWRSLDELLAVADIVSLHLPSDERTQHLLDRDRLTACKPGAVIVNTARGDLVDVVALCDLLESGHLGGAFLDVFPDEPLPPGHRLTSAPNTLLTPHVAWRTAETMLRCATIAADNCHRLRDHRPLLNVVS